MRRARLLCVVAAATISIEAFAGEGYSPPPPKSSRKLDPPASEVRLLVPAFGGEPVGVSVSTILNLQVWQTLRIPQTGPGQSTSGLVLWGATLPEVQLEAATKTAEEAGAQLILWGDAIPYADGTVVQAFLTLPYDYWQTWDIKLIWRGKMQDFSVDLPSRHYQFEPIVLRNDIVEEYRTPGDLKLYSERVGGTVKASIGHQMFRALEHNTDTVKVRLEDGASGWLRLPQISANRSEVVDFTGGVIRILRQDWSGAKRLLTSVIDNPRTPTSVRVDALLMRAQASINSGGAWKQDLAEAMRLNPYDTDTLSYAIMFNLAAAVDAGNTPARTVAVKAAAKIVDENRLLFPDDHKLIAAMDWLVKP